jgi:hypothetical protein
VASVARSLLLGLRCLVVACLHVVSAGAFLDVLGACNRRCPVAPLLACGCCSAALLVASWHCRSCGCRPDPLMLHEAEAATASLDAAGAAGLPAPAAAAVRAAAPSAETPAATSPTTSRRLASKVLSSSANRSSNSALLVSRAASRVSVVLPSWAAAQRPRSAVETGAGHPGRPHTRCRASQPRTAAWILQSWPA